MVQKIASNPDFADSAGKFNQKSIMRLAHRFFILADLLASHLRPRFEEEKCKRKNLQTIRFTGFFFGAVRQIRTADLVITNDVLCLLSYNSKWRP